MIEPLFELLLDLASTSYQLPATVASDQKRDSNCGSNDSMVPLMKSFATSALLSLVVAIGDTGKMLTAIAALLTSSHLDDEEIETPNILIASQRSVHAVLLGKTNRPDWTTHGFPGAALCDSFPLNLSGGAAAKLAALASSSSCDQLSSERSSSLAFDGRFLYLLLNGVIHKLGSGYGGTVKGHLITSRRLCTPPGSGGQPCGWIGWIKGYLYYQANNWAKNELTKMDTETLRDVGRVTLGVHSWGPSVAASDGDYLVLITASKDDSFSLRTLKPSTSSPATSNERSSHEDGSSSAAATSSPSYLMPVVQELTLKLAHKCLTACGGLGQSLFDVADGQGQVDEDNEQLNGRHGLKPIVVGGDEEVSQICSGKDFAVIRTAGGRVLLTGKAASLGIKGVGKHAAGVAGGAQGRWAELTISKTATKVSHISCGHEAAHLLLIADDGQIYFAGLAKRGEDGSDLSKGRRQPKASKPKKMAKLEGRQVIGAACNHGTSAVITKEGQLHMFGKDSTHVDKASGLVSGLKNVVITQVALGKAHTLALTDKGHVFAFGFNHKGQCGQDFGVHTTSMSALAGQPGLGGGVLVSGDKMTLDEGGLSDAQVDISEDVLEPLCTSGNHNWKYDQCMICTSCGECTGYGPGCVASGKAEVRNPGLACGCGAGDSGCYDCGVCRSCDKMVKEVGVEPHAVAAAAADGQAEGGPLNAGHFYGVLGNQRALGAGNQGAMDPYDLMAGAAAAARAVDHLAAVMSNHENDPLQRALDHIGVPPVPGNQRSERRRSALEAHISRKFRHLNRAQRLAEYARAGPGAIGSNVQADHPAIERLAAGAAGGPGGMGDEAASSDCETTKLTSLPPTKLNIAVRVVQVTCGLHHSVLLTETGEVYAFGSNQQGQLGLGDFVHREKPTKVPVSASIVQVAAGSNHTVLLSVHGQVFTFGSNQKGQLGRLPSAIDYNWNALPVALANIGPANGRRATWIDASGDYTFVKLDESLINPLTLSSARVMANSRCVVIAPSVESLVGHDVRLDDRPFKSLVINRADGSCRTFVANDQVNLASFSSMCLDSLYDVLWTFDLEASIVNRYNIVAAEAKGLQAMNEQNGGGCRLRLPTILSPEVALPSRSTMTVSRSNAAFNLLCCLHTLTRGHQLG